MPYEITERGMAEMHRELNGRLFGGALGPSRFAVDRSLKVLGSFCTRRLPAPEGSPSPARVPLITMSARMRWTLADAERVMAHEMVHQWVWEAHGPRRARDPHHGPPFLAKAAEINAALGEGFVTVRCRLGCADDGRARPVVLLELPGGSTLGCSTERRFTDRALRHIRDVAWRLGAASVLRFRTGCPDAARLPNANRTRVRQIRGRNRTRAPWPIVPDGFMDELLRAAEGKILCVWPR